MLLQQSPFRGEDEDEVYNAVLADEPLYPMHMSRDSVSILQKLLTREPGQRLGSGPTDAQEIMSQPFFRNINWDDVYHKRIQPPFQPEVKSATDTSNFDSEFTSVTPVLTPVQSGKSCPGIPNSLTNVSSSLASNARRVPRLFLLRRLCLSTLPTNQLTTNAAYDKQSTTPHICWTRRHVFIKFRVDHTIGKCRQKRVKQTKRRGAKLMLFQML